jgi:hypothetical protein
MFTVEFADGTTYKFNTYKEAMAFRDEMVRKFQTTAQIYPTEPVQLCSACLKSEAVKGHDLCEPCLAKMLDDMEEEHDQAIQDAYEAKLWKHYNEGRDK